MEASGVGGGGADKRPIVDLVKDKNGTDQILLQNPKGASVKVIDSSFCFSHVNNKLLRCKDSEFDFSDSGNSG